METEVLSIRVKKSLKDEAEKMGVDFKAAVEGLLEDIVAEKKAKAQATRRRTPKANACQRGRVDTGCQRDKARNVNIS